MAETEQKEEKMKKELEKVYDPKQVEDKTYRFWVEKRYFHAEPNPKKKPYTIVIPPPRTIWAGRAFWSAPGNGKRPMAEKLLSS